MNINKTTLILILITITAIVLVFQAQAQANQEIEKYCRTNQGCVPFTGELTDTVCISNMGGTIINANEYDAQCPVACCCGLDPEGLYTKGYCAELEGDFRDGIESADACSFTCSPGSHTISAQINHTNADDEALGRYYLLISNEPMYEGSFSGGVLQINNVRDETYSLRIIAEKTILLEKYVCTHQQEIVVNGDKNLGNIILNNCALDTSDSQTPQPSGCISTWHYEFSGDGCGEVLSFTDQAGCEPATSEPMYDVGDEVQCLGGDFESLCGNGKLDAGEQCDKVGNNYMFAGSATCQTRNFNAGILQCSNCLIDASLCTNCPTTSQGCTSSLLCGNCPICAESDLCVSPPTCNDGDSLNLEATRLYANKAGIRLNWTAITPCLNDGSISLYKKYCGDTECDVVIETDNELRLNMDANPTTYDDYNFERPNKVYCYKAVLQSGDAIIESLRACARLPEPVCVGKPNNQFFCDDDIKLKCDEGLKIDEINCATEGEGMRCINPTGNEAMCASQDICDSCSGPFGMFGFLTINSNLQKDEILCSETEARRICFREDFSNRLTAFGKLNHCADVSSCYDYNTKGSCERNVCLDSVDACKWNSLNQNELGLGVCTPENASKQDCKACDEYSPFNYCSEEMCRLYGDTCYYNAQPNKTRNAFIINKYYCNNVDEVGCETYNNRDECEGAQGSRSEFNINIGYENTVDNLLRAISGNHSRTSLSNDILSRGICVWTEDKCVRDADFTTSHIPGVSDCGVNDLECLTNFEVPISNVTINGLDIVNRGTYSTQQLYTQAIRVNPPNPNQIKYTHFSIGEQYSYPRMKFNQFANYAKDITEEGQYIIAYYSRDKSNNLEEIKNFTITLLTSLKITVSESISARYYPEQGLVLSNLTLNVNGPQYEFTCEGILFEGEDNAIGETITKKGQGTITWNYNYLADGLYNFLVNCKDGYGQTNTTNYEFIIDKDNTLSNSTPQNIPLRANTVTISVISSSDATCRYEGEGGVKHGVEEDFTNSYRLDDGRYNHTATITTIEEGVYIFRPICDFADQDIGTFRGNNADRIYFGIDRTPPSLTVYDREQSAGLSRSIYNDSKMPNETLNLEFECVDNNITFSGRQLSFGCKDTLSYNIYYTEFERVTTSAGVSLEEKTQASAYGSVNGPNPIAGLIETGKNKTFTAPNEHRKITLEINVSDRGDNSKIEEINLRLRVLDYATPDVIICDEELEICS